MKSWKIFALLALLGSVTLGLQAQNDIVRLKNGSIIKGTLIEYIVNDHVRIQTVDGNVREFPGAEVETVDAGGAYRTRKPIPLKTKGYYNVMTLGLNLGTANYGMRGGPGLYMLNGFQIKPRLFTGVSVGAENINGVARFPLAVDVRYKFLNANFSPFVGAYTGYTLSGKSPEVYYYDIWPPYYQNEKNHGGINAGAQVGIMTQLGQHLGLTASVGYRHQQFSREYTSWFWNGTENIPLPVTEKQYLNRMTLGFGVIFN